MAFFTSEKWKLKEMYKPQTVSFAYYLLLLCLIPQNSFFALATSYVKYNKAIMKC